MRGFKVDLATLVCSRAPDLARFGASFYIRTRDRFAMDEGVAETTPASTPIDEL